MAITSIPPLTWITLPRGRGSGRGGDGKQKQEREGPERRPPAKTLHRPLGPTRVQIPPPPRWPT
jgi:hypothetical protein